MKHLTPIILLAFLLSCTGNSPRERHSVPAIHEKQPIPVVSSGRQPVIAKKPDDNALSSQRTSRRRVIHPEVANCIDCPDPSPSGTVIGKFLLNNGRDTVLTTTTGMKIIVPAHSFVRKKGRKLPSGTVVLKVMQRLGEQETIENTRNEQLEVRGIYTFDAYEGKQQLELKRELAFGFPSVSDQSLGLYTRESKAPQWEQYIHYLPSLATTSAPTMPDHPIMFGVARETFGRLLTALLTYPQEEFETGVGGKVYAQFIYSEYGCVTEAKILKKVAPAIDKAVLKAIKSLPDGFPACQMEEFIPQTYTVLVIFDPEKGITVKEPEPGWQKPESGKVFYIRSLGTYAVVLLPRLPLPNTFPRLMPYDE